MRWPARADASQTIESIGTVATFAQAGEMNLAEATKSLANAQSSLGLKSADPKNMEELARVGDVLVDAANSRYGQ